MNIQGPCNQSSREAKTAIQYITLQKSGADIMLSSTESRKKNPPMHSKYCKQYKINQQHKIISCFCIHCFNIQFKLYCYPKWHPYNCQTLYSMITWPKSRKISEFLHKMLRKTLLKCQQTHQVYDIFAILFLLF